MVRHSLALLFGICVIGVESSRAAVIYSQTLPEEPHAAFASNDSLSTSQRMADNFSFVSATHQSIRSLRFIGGSGLTDETPDEFRVVFFEDAGGTPGMPLTDGDFDIGPAFRRSPTGGELLNGATTPLEYIINLPHAITLNPNTTFWISITNDLLPSTGWGWARADGVLDQMTASTLGSLETPQWNTFSNGGMWFELNDQIVPEPSSLAIVLTALMSTMLQRKRLINQSVGWVVLSDWGLCTRDHASDRFTHQSRGKRWVRAHHPTKVCLWS